VCGSCSEFDFFGRKERRKEIAEVNGKQDEG
jgi:hypothetical protein